MSEHAEIERVKWERRQFIIQTTLAVVGVFGLIVYGWQLYEMRRATEAAAASARAAEAGVALARDVEAHDRRPWITITSLKLTKPLVLGETPTIAVTLANSGKTPALQITIAGNAYV